MGFSHAICCLTSSFTVALSTCSRPRPCIHLHIQPAKTKVKHQLKLATPAEL